MIVKFKKVKVHGFLSFKDAELRLNDRGYCLICGVNNNPKDNAKSNGSGKSSIISAICWCITGETVQGLTSNIPNLFLNEGCWVELEFIVDGNTYVVTRYRDDPVHKTDLKIIVNGEDKSGKGIRESEKVLKELLPDLTSQLICSVIILGQDLPYKFSSNTPAGRKEVLEQLSKSDFMIQDIKDRLNNRSTKLANDLHIVDTEIVRLEATKKVHNESLEQQNHKLVELSQPKTFDADIANLTKELSECENNLTDARKFADKLIDEKNDCSHQLDLLQQDEKNELDKIEEEYSSKLKPLQDNFRELEIKYTTLKREVDKIKSIPDICPTCGQKMPAGMKPSTEAQEKELAELDKIKANGYDKILKVEDNHTNGRNTTLNKYNEKIESFKKTFEELRKSESDNQKVINELLNKKVDVQTKLNKVTMEKDSYTKSLTECKELVDSLTKKISEIVVNLKEQAEQKQNLENHIEVIDKMNTLVKRDFRGFLLSHVIEFIDKTAKEYCQDIFGTTELNFMLEGNNINIDYCGKAYENLSGGEKRKVDIIVQFSIRKMMTQYLDFRTNILCVDEIFDGLDAYGCTNVINFISNRLSDIESVFIISHHADTLEIPYDSEVVVIKDASGMSSIL